MTLEEHGESFHWPDPSADVVRRRLPPKRRHGRWGVVGKFLGYLTASMAATAAGYYEVPGPEAGGGYRGAWAQWLDMTYTGDSYDSAWVGRLDDLDARLSATFDGYFVGNELHRESFDKLIRDEGTLADIVPKMSGEDRGYFAMARSIARGILEEVSALGSTGPDR